MFDQDIVATASESDNRIAAIDLGSNSFHMVVADTSLSEIRPIDLLSEKVQLAAGLDKNKVLSQEAMDRGLACLSRFAQRVQHLPRNNVRIVGTNALRQAVNAHEFIRQAAELFDAPLEVIAGREEARLIYLGVSHTLADDKGKRLVIDIGGGSTEFIIGERFEPQVMESLHLGCVTFSAKYFPDGEITAGRFKKAQTGAMQELQTIAEEYKELGWNSVVGSSGTIKAARNALIECGYSDEKITKKGLQKLKDHLLSFDHVNNIQISGIKPERRAVLPAGIAVLCGIFESLGIDEMYFSHGALREGLLYDMSGRFSHEDVRERTISALIQRYHVSVYHANLVRNTALFAWAQVKDDWGLDNDSYYSTLSWAAWAHKIGLVISHSQFHKHGAYILQNSDLAGFTGLDQQMMATLVRGHRRKFPRDEFKALPARLQEPCRRLCILLRFGVIMHRSRANAVLPAISMKAGNYRLALEFPKKWLEHHPLTLADLQQEADYLKALNFTLTFK
ncbi:MAG: exopolyphosphatase [Pontibacterium sp.]